ncbi:MAG: septum formation initiator family protein [Erysipelotrichaceae bacterium]|nr:septum formation initiator family protein [Erysipelotrichaceae bacterium]MBQ7888968.1 septum formation initiator family protein [Erysipelotrichaceae bacterium]
MIYGVAREVMNTMELKNQLDDVKQRLETIQAENEQLTSQQEKLQDPNYVQSYARGNYMLSKEGEQIFYLPSEGSTDEDAEDTGSN